MRGNKPKPTPSRDVEYLRLISGPAEGAAEADPVKESAPAPAPDPDPCADYPAPRDFSDDEREVWRYLVDHLTRRSLLERGDVFKLEVLTRQLVEYRRLVRFFDERDDEKVGNVPRGRTYVVVGRSGRQIKARPEVAMMNEAIRVIDKYGSDFGLSPAARMRLREGDRGFDDDQDGLFDSVG